MKAYDQSVINQNFSYHKPKEENVPKFESIRNVGKIFAEAIINYSPPSPEQTLALRKAEEAVMWANAALARNQ